MMTREHVVSRREFKGTLGGLVIGFSMAPAGCAAAAECGARLPADACSQSASRRVAAHRSRRHRLSVHRPR